MACVFAAGGESWVGVAVSGESAAWIHDSVVGAGVELAGPGQPVGVQLVEHVREHFRG